MLNSDIQIFERHTHDISLGEGATETHTHIGRPSH